MHSATIRQFKNSAIKELQEISPSPELDVQVLLSHALNYDKTRLLLFAENHIPDDKLEWLNEAIARRKTGLPVAYITGMKEFYGYDFFVTTDVLIPKPDTEILVEQAVQRIADKIRANKRILSICDMCTGSGCIAISVLMTLSEKYKLDDESIPVFTMVDISEKALEVARKNTSQILKRPELLQKIRFIRSNLFENVTGRFDFILSNPPYIPHSMVKELLKDRRNEPVLALDGDVTMDGELTLKDDGMEVIRNLIEQSTIHLYAGGTTLMETGEYNAEKTSDFARIYGFKTKIYKDLENQPRVVQMKIN